MSFKQKLFLWGQNQIQNGAWFLAPFSFGFAIGSWVRNTLFDLGVFKTYHVRIPVISVGNIVAGGTGKTPFVCFLASYFSNQSVAILSRGYGDLPDEAMLLQKKLPFAKVYIGKNRVKLAQTAEKEGRNLIILDDGFQHRQLARDLEIVLVRGEDPLGKGHFLPWGFLRDSPKRLKKANLVFSSGPCIQKLLVDTIELTTEIQSIRNFLGKNLMETQNIPIAFFCAIANPRSFQKILSALGFKIIFEWILFDHQNPKDEELERFIQNAKALGAQKILCTEKDFVRLKPPFSNREDLYFVEIATKLTNPSTLFECEIEKIQKKLNNPSAL